MIRSLFPILSFILFLVSCSTEPQPINFGKDLCEHCNMTIIDNKFGAEMINSKGKAIKFDSGECMFSYLNAEKKFDAKQYLIVNYFSEGELMDAHKAFFLHGGEIVSPMGGKLAAFKSKTDAEELQKKLGGDIIAWDEANKIQF